MRNRHIGRDGFRNFIIKYLSDVLADPELKPKNYWVHSSSQPVLTRILNIGFNKHLEDKTEALIFGKNQNLDFDFGRSLIDHYKEHGKKLYTSEEGLFSHILFMLDT